MDRFTEHIAVLDIINMRPWFTQKHKPNQTLRVVKIKEYLKFVNEFIRIIAMQPGFFFPRQGILLIDTSVCCFQFDNHHNHLRY